MKDTKKTPATLVCVRLPGGGVATFDAVPNPRVKKHSEWLRKFRKNATPPPTPDKPSEG
jgi:hypothetical protein